MPCLTYVKARNSEAPRRAEGPGPPPVAAAPPPRAAPPPPGPGRPEPPASAWPGGMRGAGPGRLPACFLRPRSDKARNTGLPWTPKKTPTPQRKGGPVYGQPRKGETDPFDGREGRRGAAKIDLDLLLARGRSPCETSVQLL